KLTTQSVAWIEQEVERWIEQRISQRDSHAEVQK
ncbi:MAG: AlpA family phage regulatory protein, partial [Methyloprofundus sp.]|nr:AlpA family phage regulatory protein [Methyloprofundus sp.]